MLETLSILGLVLLLAVLVVPGCVIGFSRWGKGLFYGSALVVILSWTLLKSIFVLAGRRMLGRSSLA